MPPFLPARGVLLTHRSKRKIIVILVCADPEPVIMTISLASECAIATTDLGGIYAAFLAKA